MSDNGEVLKNFCYYNPAYGETTQEMYRRHCNTPKPSVSPVEAFQPPPLPPRPPLTPVAILKHGFSKEDFSDFSETEKSPGKSGGSSPLMTIKKKPSPPPKPVNLFKKVSGSSSIEFQKYQEEDQDQATRPESPDYIVPNRIVQASSKKKLQSAKKKQTNVYPGSCNYFAEQCPVRFEHICAKTPGKFVSGACSSKNINMQGSKNKKKTSLKPKQSEDSSSKRQLMAIPSPWSKLKKPEESMFYVKRRCSSVPDLPSLDIHAEPVYLDLQELWDNRNRSISESNSPVE